MAQPTSVRVQTLSGQWETLGVDRYPGIFPEGVRPVADEGGSAAFTFTMQRNPDLPQLDLLAWTPCEIEINGKVVWEGRIRETPGQHGAAAQISVSAEGWQAHLDNDVLEHTWMHEDLTQWVDSRSLPGVNLAQLIASPQVTTANGAITIQIPAGTVLPATTAAGVTLDLGEFAGVATGVVCDFTITGANAGISWRFRTSAITNPVTTGLVDAPGSATVLANGSNTLGGYLSIGGRYVHVFVFFGAGLTVGAADVAVQITRLLVSGTVTSLTQPLITAQFGTSGNPAVSGIGQSDLRASDVIIDAAAKCAPLLTVTPRSPAYKDEVVGDAPLSYWRLGQGTPPSDRLLTGTNLATVDLGTLNNPLLNLGSGGHTNRAAGLLVDDNDEGFSFDGTSISACAIHGQNPTLYSSAAGSLEAVVNLAAFNAGAFGSTIVRVENHMMLRVNATTHRFEILAWIGGGTTTWAANSVTVTLGTTYHLFAAYETSGTGYLWVNGTAAALTRTVTSGTGLGTLAAGTDLWIGNWSGFTEPWNGTIDEVSVYGYAIDSHTVDSHYTAARARTYGGVQRTQLKIPHYAPVGAKTLREHAGAVNALHGWRVKMLPGRQLMFQPQPTAISMRAASVEFQDGAANTGDEIYNQAVVEANDATGAPVRVRIGAGEVFPNAPTTTDGVPQIVNPGFETNVTTGWTTVISFGATWTRVTSPVRSGAGAAQMNMILGSILDAQGAVSGGTGLFFAGVTYRGSCYINLSATFPWTLRQEISLEFGAVGDLALVGGVLGQGLGLGGVTANTWIPVSIVWTPQTTHLAADVTFRIIADNVVGGDPTYQMWIDDVAVTRLAPTLLDRRGFVNTKILTSQSAIDKDTGKLLARAFLQSNSSIPFRGSFTASKPDDVLLVNGDTPVHPSELLLHTGELVRLPLIDPNTGDIGRDGKIALVTYDDQAEQATVTIDDDRTNFETLLSRMAVTSQQAGIT